MAITNAPVGIFNSVSSYRKLFKKFSDFVGLGLKYKTLTNCMKAQFS